MIVVTCSQHQITFAIFPKSGRLTLGKMTASLKSVVMGTCMLKDGFIYRMASTEAGAGIRVHVPEAPTGRVSFNGNGDVWEKYENATVTIDNVTVYKQVTSGTIPEHFRGD